MRPWMREQSAGLTGRSLMRTSTSPSPGVGTCCRCTCVTSSACETDVHVQDSEYCRRTLHGCSDACMEAALKTATQVHFVHLQAAEACWVPAR